MKASHSFSEYLKTVISDDLTVQMIDAVLSAFTLMPLKKNAFFVKEGEVCQWFCFIESGILQHSIMVLDEEKTTYLALRNSVTSSLSSFLFGTPSRKSVKAIADCNLWVINFKDFKELLTNNKTFHQFYYNVIEKQICLIDDYRIDLLTMTPEERYKKLLANDPALLQEVALHYLASFLGISSRHMSRIRKNIK